MPEKILIVGTHGPEDPERASLPFVVANAALAMDVEAVVALQGTAVLLARKCVSEHIISPGLPPLRELLGTFLELGGKLLLCTPCVKVRELPPDSLVSGAELVAGARVVQEALEADAVFNY